MMGDVIKIQIKVFKTMAVKKCLQTPKVNENNHL